MENVVKTRLQSVLFADAQIYRNIVILPLVAEGSGALQYRTLGESLAAGEVTITEVSTAGSVPELQVLNRGHLPVLLVDGEEVAGAKQNRVLNTSILVKANSETRIPVSCTEQGRWCYLSTAFAESGNVMAYRSRSKKTRSVHASLEESGAHHSDQGEVWQEIVKLHGKAGTHSPTSAMKDVFDARGDDLRKFEEAFKPVPNQVGLLAFIGGTPAGLELVSLASVYAKLHPKLVRSYTLEALLDQGRELSPLSAAPDTILPMARKFLDEIIAAGEQQFPSISHGMDHRYKAPTISGTALVHENEVIHAAFFRLDKPDPSTRMASLQRRRTHLGEL